MKKLLFIIAGFFLFSCGRQDPSEALKNINGYWQIDHVQIQKDSVIKYGFSQYIDYIKLSDSTGFRKKLEPDFSGKFRTTQNAEKIKPVIEDDKLFLHYSTPYDQWKEEVLEADEDELILKNRDGKIYYYKRYQPISLEEHEAKKE
ncbi:hypothetical protein C7S20_12100 [Christiangramia fulva]|uniref:Lipocalin-like domain-containing protein n=1 Tax=Christiangramia fulva TaxID=2126553 RepID=A0A2R3Z6U1_9FLAO|nr:lipocalin family protein [Christiangramia fulva]AVR45934.1 hypothetical protein C7S20_12100 [Christiangramia fulva]